MIESIGQSLELLNIAKVIIPFDISSLVQICCGIVQYSDIFTPVLALCWT